MSALFFVNCRAVLRRRTAAVLLVLTVVIGVCAAMILQGLTVRQETELLRIKEETVISCRLTDVNGGRQEGLGLADVVLATLLGRRDPHGARLEEIVKNVRAMAEIPTRVPENTAVACITALGADPALTPEEGGVVTFYDGWNESILLSDKRVCIVPEGTRTERKGGVETLRVISEVFDTNLQVIGTYTGGSGKIYTPFYSRWDDEISVARHAQSCSFDIRDNFRLEEAKERLYEFRYFVEPSIYNDFDGTKYGLIVQDDTYQAAVGQIEDNLRTLHILLPVLLGLFCLLGFFVSSLSTRGRKREFAVMRCLGMKRGAIFALVFSEQLVLAVPAALAGLVIGAIVGGLHLRALADALLLLVLFLAGTAISILFITNINVMRLMKTEEESEC